MAVDTSRRRRRPATPLAEIASALVDPLLARRAGMTSALIAAWPEIAGPKLATSTRPDRILWTARRSDLDPFEPATLVVACEAASGLRLQHETGELLQRIDLFFGYRAVGRLKLVQIALPAAPVSRKPKLGALGDGERRTIAAATAGIESPRLKAALERFGEGVLSRNRG